MGSVILLNADNIFEFVKFIAQDQYKCNTLQIHYFKNQWAINLSIFLIYLYLLII